MLHQGPCWHSAPACAFQSGYYPHGAQSADYTYSRLAVHNATHLHWQQVSVTSPPGPPGEALTQQQQQRRVIDDWWVVQRRHGPFGKA